MKSQQAECRTERRACVRCQRSSVTIHARGLCGNCYKNHRDEFPRSNRYRPFSAKERAFIKDQWGKRTAKDIAELLGRKVEDIYSAAMRFGVSKPKHVLKTNPKLRERIVALHGDGLSDREIAQVVGFNHSTVGRWLRRIGLASNCRTKPTDPFPERTRKKQSRIARQRIRDEGLEFAVPFLMKHLEGRIEAIRMGWPQAKNLFEASVLESLFGHGASTAEELAIDVGGSLAWAGQVVRDLKRRKLVAVWYRTNHVCHYGLAFGLKKKWEREREYKGESANRCENAV